MSRTLIVARIRPGAEAEVGRIFARSDASDLPHALGVRERSLYTLDDVYIHVVDVEGDSPGVLDRARSLPAFRQISRDLEPYIAPYRSTWSSPQDAVATQFYHWQPSA